MTRLMEVSKLADIPELHQVERGKLADFPYEPVAYDHEEFLRKALKKKGFKEEYEKLEDE